MYRDRQHGVRRGVAEAVFEQPADARLVVDGHHQGLDAVEHPRPHQHPTHERGTGPDSGGADPQRVGGQQQTVARQWFGTRVATLYFDVTG